MNVLVSDTSKKYENWVVVRTLLDVVKLRGTVENLVFHKSSETVDDKIKYLTSISKKYVSCKIVYVCESSKADKAIRMLVTGGLDGKYIDDEFYLEDDNELDNLLSDLPMIVESSELASSNVLQDFFNRYMANGDVPISKGYLRAVKQAAVEMTESYHAKSLELIQNALAGFNHSKYPWLEWDENLKSGKLLHKPERADIPETIKEQLIVELYSK